MEIIPILLQEAQAFSWIDWWVTFTALIYVFLAARGNIWCWFWGIMSCSFWAYASFMFYDLWLDALLQVFYVIMGVVGIYQWKFGQKGKLALFIQNLPKHQHLPIILIGGLFTFFFGYFFEQYTTAAATYLDAFTTVFSILATFLLIRKIIENWLYWIVIDVVYLYLYASRGAYLFALIMLIYVIIAVDGYLKWRKLA